MKLHRSFSKEREKKVQPPKLYDLTTLQREANRLLGFTAQQTLDYTQNHESRQSDVVGTVHELYS